MREGSAVSALQGPSLGQMSPTAYEKGPTGRVMPGEVSGEDELLGGGWD